LNYHRDLIALRHTHPALRIGTYRVLYAEGNGYAFVRSLDDTEIIVAVNIGMESVQIQLDLASLGLQSHPERVVFGAAKIDGKGEELKIDLPPRSGGVLM
jgi:cyclomaltodextrinase / maltogenic alpha-amylase / neopullulanase